MKRERPRRYTSAITSDRLDELASQGLPLQAALCRIEIQESSRAGGCGMNKSWMDYIDKTEPVLDHWLEQLDRAQARNGTDDAASDPWATLIGRC